MGRERSMSVLCGVNDLCDVVWFFDWIVSDYSHVTPGNRQGLISHFVAVPFRMLACLMTGLLRRTTTKKQLALIPAFLVVGVCKGFAHFVCPCINLYVFVEANIYFNHHALRASVLNIFERATILNILREQTL